MNKTLRHILILTIISSVIACVATLLASDQNPAGFHLVAVDGCGVPAHEAPVWGQTPPLPWELDSTAGGTNDFRSSKFNILWAALTDGAGKGVRVESDGRQTVRAWVDQDRVRLLVSDFSNGGSQVVLRDTHYAHEQKTLPKGDMISGSVRLTLSEESK